MSFTELITLVLIDAWRTVTGRNDPKRVEFPLFGEEEEEEEGGERGFLEEEDEDNK